MLHWLIDWNRVKQPRAWHSRKQRFVSSKCVIMGVYKMSSCFWSLHTLPWCPTPFKAWDHRWHQDWEWASTASMCTQELLTYCVVHQPKNLWFTCKPIDHCSHRFPLFSVNFAFVLYILKYLFPFNSWSIFHSNCCE